MSDQDDFALVRVRNLVFLPDDQVFDAGKLVSPLQNLQLLAFNGLLLFKHFWVRLDQYFLVVEELVLIGVVLHARLEVVFSSRETVLLVALQLQLVFIEFGLVLLDYFCLLGQLELFKVYLEGLRIFCLYFARQLFSQGPLTLGLALPVLVRNQH